MLPGIFACGAGLIQLQKVLTSLLEAGDQVLGIWWPASLQSPFDFKCGHWSRQHHRLHLFCPWIAQLRQPGPCPALSAVCADEKTNKYSLSTWPRGQLPFLCPLLSLLEQSSRACFSSSPSRPGTAPPLPGPPGTPGVDLASLPGPRVGPASPPALGPGLPVRTPGYTRPPRPHSDPRGRPGLPARTPRYTRPPRPHSDPRGRPGLPARTRTPGYTRPTWPPCPDPR